LNKLITKEEEEEQEEEINFDKKNPLKF